MVAKLSAPPTADLLIAAYERHAEEIRNFPASKQLARVNFDFTAATAIVLGAQPALLEHRAYVRENLPKFTLRYIDELDSITHAALYVYMQTMTAPTPEGQLVELTESARKQRKTLVADVVSAIGHELMPENALENVPTGNGRLQIAQGLIGVCVALRAWWPRLKGQTAVTEALLVKGTQTAIDLLSALGRDENPAMANESLPSERQWLQAVSFFYYAYSQCRRAMEYARWDEGDAADIAPGLVGPRGPRVKAAGDDGEAEEKVPAVEGDPKKGPKEPK